MKKITVSVLPVLFVFLIFSISLNAAEIDPLDVTIQQGALHGVKDDSALCWRNIPYAKPPLGNLRFRAPQPPNGWQGVRDATGFGNIAPQYNRLTKEPYPRNEDCLNLNIWAPARNGEKRPVMVWIHGGGFWVGAGSSPMYHAADLAKNGDVVVVTFNYRLGALGFLYLDSMGGSAAGFDNNLGLRDQVAALQWVHDNIAAFGGNPDQVTIFGESAGGASVQALMAIPSARGLFKRAICESGPSDLIFTRQEATDFTRGYLTELGVSSEHLELLKSLPADTLVAAMTRLFFRLKGQIAVAKSVRPVIDGTFIPEDPAHAIGSGRATGIPLMIGTNHDETTLLSNKRVHTAPRKAAELQPYIDKIDPAKRGRFLAAYPDYPRYRGVIEMGTDAIFAMPSISFAEQQAQYAPAYMYRFDMTTFTLNLAGLHACHGSEMPMVFGTLNIKPGKYFYILSNKKRDREVSHFMEQCWANFARYGNPDPTGELGWLPYSAASRNTMIFDKKSRVEPDPDSNRRRAWLGVDAFIRK